MKKLFVIFIPLLEIIATNTYATSENYVMDPTHTYVEWHISHFGYSHPSGKWMVADGMIALDKQEMSKSKVNVTINVADLVTGLPSLDDHLKGADFFNVESYPLATFASTKVSKISNNKFQVAGNLTLHGITKPVTLAVVENKIALSPITTVETAGFSAKTKIKRSDFGMSKYTPGLGDDVDLDIEVEAIPKLAPQK